MDRGPFLVLVELRDGPPDTMSPPRRGATGAGENTRSTWSVRQYAFEPLYRASFPSPLKSKPSSVDMSPPPSSHPCSGVTLPHSTGIVRAPQLRGVDVAGRRAVAAV